MRFKLIILLLIVSFGQLGLGLNLISIQRDKVFIEKFIDTYQKGDPDDISKFFNPPGKYDTTTLGLGYYLVDQQKSSANVSIKAKFIYQNDSLVGCRILPTMPKDVNLQTKYKNWYAPIFTFKDSTQILPLYSNYESWIAPFPQYQGPLNIMEQSKPFQDYISTESGDVFGYFNGWYGLHRNRALFEGLLPTIEAEEIEMLMYSKNPITRLQAFYYFLTHENEFSSSRKNVIAAWMKKVVNDPSHIYSAEGDVIDKEPAEERLMYYVNIDLDRGNNPNPDTCAYFGIGSFQAFFMKSDNDSLTYFSGCPLTALELMIVDRYGTILAEINEVHNPIHLDLSEKIVNDGEEEFKFNEGYYFWKAKYSFSTPSGFVTKETQSQLRIFR